MRLEAWKTRIDLTEDFPDFRFTDSFDRDSLHWGIKEEGEIVAAASLHITSDAKDVPCAKQIIKYLGNFPGPYYMCRKLVVSPKVRGKGYSHILDSVRISYIHQSDIGTAMVIISSPFRVQKLNELGFQQACKIGDFQTYPGGASTLMVARSKELLV